ncbi:family 10 glycosylhydrolase [bacterium]|nr:family 10 glycosylhydrolase [bacterium]
MSRNASLALLPALFALPVAAQTAEHRGLWMTSASYATPEKAEATVARAAAAHLNALYPIVWSSGQTWFKCSLVPMAENVTPGFDPLENLIRVAHASGLQVHPWFVNGWCGNIHPGSVADRRPEWLVKPGQPLSATWYDFGQADVRHFETQVMMECLRQYEVDGLHYDYIRFGSQVFCYCDTCLAEFARRTGLPPIEPNQGKFPLWLTTVGNPLAQVTTAQVLATFEDGSPAITLNRLGAGETVLVNWQGARYITPTLNGFVTKLLGHFEVQPGALFQLHTTQTKAKSGSGYQTRATKWLKDLGFDSEMVDETGLSRVPVQGTVLLTHQTRMDEATATRLREFVSGGGHCLFMDGPTNAISFPALQETIGLKAAARMFYGPRLVTPAPGQDLIPSGPAYDVATAPRRIDRWIEYRKDCVTDLVREVREEARKVKPQAPISAAVFFTKAEADGVCQDWYRWLREDLIDYAIPMAYTESNDDLQAALREWQAADPKMERIIPGLGIWTNRNGRDVTRPSAQVLAQIQTCRAAGAHGNLFFQFNCLSDDLVSALAGNPYQQVCLPYFPPARQP